MTGSEVVRLRRNREVGGAAPRGVEHEVDEGPELFGQGADVACDAGDVLERSGDEDGAVHGLRRP